MVPTYALFTQRRIMAHAHYLVHLDKLRKWIEIRPKLDANSKRIKYSPKKTKIGAHADCCVFAEAPRRKNKL